MEAQQLPPPPAVKKRHPIRWLIVGSVIGAILLIWGGHQEKDKGPISWAEFVYANGGPGGVCDVAFSEVPTHLAEQWGRRCITGAG